MDIELVAEVRTRTGKGGARSTRRAEKVPATVYGRHVSPLSIAVSAKQLEKVLQTVGEDSRLLSLRIDGEGEDKARHVLIREIQKHPVRKMFLHVDFYEVAMDQLMIMDVPVELTGEPEGIKLGGILNLIRRTLSVRCLPSEIPEKVEIDVSGLNMGETLHVSDLIGKTPFELADDPSFAVATLIAPEAAKGTEPAEEEVSE